MTSTSAVCFAVSRVNALVVAAREAGVADKLNKTPTAAGGTGSSERSVVAVIPPSPSSQLPLPLPPPAVAGSWGTKITRLVQDLRALVGAEEKALVFSQWDEVS